MTLHKKIRSEYGGGLKEFVFEDQEYFEGVEDSTTFLNSQERQSIVRHMLHNLRATEDDQLGNIKFLDGQAIGKSHLDVRLLSPFHFENISSGWWLRTNISAIAEADQRWTIKIHLLFTTLNVFLLYFLIQQDPFVFAVFTLVIGNRRFAYRRFTCGGRCFLNVNDLSLPLIPRRISVLE